MQENNNNRNHKVRAHFSGIVLQVLVEPGVYVKKGITKICRIKFKVSLDKDTYAMTVLKSPVSGNVISFNFEEDQEFKEEDLLMEVEDVDIFEDIPIKMEEDTESEEEDEKFIKTNNYKATDLYHQDFVPLSKENIETETRWDSHIKRLQSQRMILVCDLDNTLIHSTYDDSIIEWIKNNGFNEFISQREISYFVSQAKFECMVKIRPWAIEFLEKASEMFDIYIFTMARSGYAEMIMNMIDPLRLYTKGFISRDDIKEDFKKIRRVVSEEEEDATIVLDDRLDIWREFGGVMNIHPYLYFPEKKDDSEHTKEEAASEMNLLVSNDSECEESHPDLKIMLEILSKIHETYFTLIDHELYGRQLDTVSASSILKYIRQNILRNTCISFSNPEHEKVEDIKRVCKFMGSRCEKKVTSTSDEKTQTKITHIIVLDENQKTPSLDSSVWMISEKWVKDCLRYWMMMPESAYLVL